MVYLTVTLPPYAEPEFMGIIRDNANDVHMFRAPTSRPNVAYSVVGYEVDEFGRGDITAVCRLVDDKLEEYPAPAKIIVYSSDASAEDEIRKAWESADGRVVVATNAFGLGIGRPDVRVVIHIGPVYQLRRYSQESVRAGWDGKRSETVILMPLLRSP
ncbi:hypothetical protein BGZ57DRAFT_936884 [Hyaloscypha finlandica]|nr:hypothetical protein BGZ57DRAFT_936884 [Hyaloscypha finlandica]